MRIRHDPFVEIECPPACRIAIAGGSVAVIDDERQAALTRGTLNTRSETKQVIVGTDMQVAANRDRANATSDEIALFAQKVVRGYERGDHKAPFSPISPIPSSGPVAVRTLAWASVLSPGARDPADLSDTFAARLLPARCRRKRQSTDP